MSTDKNTIKNWFKTSLKPTQAQFWAAWDSFWHKDEKLPISSIDNLGGLLDGKAESNHTHTNYATNDATTLTAENVTAWQNKLGVADLKFDDKAITITQDYADFGLVAGDSINTFNNAIYSEVAKKLDAPTENATNEYVLMADGSVVAKSDFGKVKSVNGKEGDVILKTSDLENDSDFTTNATLTAHTSNKNNPHNVTKEQIGLGSVDNTSDINKPISTATQNALNNKADDSLVVHIDGYEVINGEKTFTKAIVSPTYPTDDFHLTNKTYVDSKIENIEINYVLKSRIINTENGLEGGGELDKDLYIGIDSVTRTNIDKGVEGYEFSTKMGNPESLIPDWSNDIITKTNF